MNRAGTVFSCVLLAFALLLPGCVGKTPAPAGLPAKPAGPAPPPGKFSGQWWEHYERGLFESSQGQPRAAMADFREAIAKRGQDQWQAPLDKKRAVDYFPHRELAILYLANREYDKAIAELQLSLAAAPSAKADYFMNKARIGRIGRSDSDRKPPEIVFQGSTTEEVTSRSRITLAGSASDDTYLAELRVDNRPIPLTLTEKQKPFRVEVALHEGKNSFTAVATDIAGKTTEQRKEIICDRRGPRIEIEQLTAAGGQVTVAGNVSDDYGLASLTVNGEVWPITGKSAVYNFKFSLPEGRLTIVATDRAGNVTGARVRRSVADPDGAAAAPLPAASAAAPADREPPVIQVEDLSDEQTTTADTIRLSGAIIDSSLLVYVSLNGSEIKNRRGHRLYFSQVLALQPGENDIRLQAADALGNKARKVFRVTREIKSVQRIDARLELALLPFAGGTEAAGPEGDLRTRLRTSLLDLDRFLLTDQRKVDAACRQLGLNPAAPVSPEDAARIGQAVGAQAVLAARIIPGADDLEIFGQIIDADTATVLSRNDVYAKSRDGKATEGLLAELAGEFTRAFPLAEGVLTEAQGKEVKIQLGARQTLRPLTRLLCYREGPPAWHPVTGESLPPDLEVIGELVVTGHDKDIVRATAVTQKEEFAPGDKVIAR